MLGGRKGSASGIYCWPEALNLAASLRTQSILKRCSLHEHLSVPEQYKNAFSVTHHELFDTELEKLAIHTNASWVLDWR